MAKIKRSGNRLSIGSWSIPFAPSDSANKKASRNSTAPPPVAAKEPEIDTTSERSVAKPTAKEPEIETAVAQSTTSSLIQLAATITRETEKLDRFIKESGAPVPSFDVDAPLDFPKLPDDIKTAREEVVRATKELGDLVTGPRESIRWMAWDVSFHHDCN
jgi:hypothetical protein